MNPLRRPDGSLETRVVTYFPAGARLQLTRLPDDNLEIQVAWVEQPEAVSKNAPVNLNSDPATGPIAASRHSS